MDFYQNRYLEYLISQFKEYKNDFPEGFMENIYKELLLTTFICPTYNDCFVWAGDESNMEELFIPAFTNFEYYQNIDNGKIVPQDFELMELIELSNEHVGGILFNPNIDNFVLPKANFDKFHEIEFPEYNIENIKKSQFKRLIKFNNLDFIKDFKNDDFNIKGNDYDEEKFQKFLESLSNSFLYVLMATNENIKSRSRENIHNSARFSNLGYFILSPHNADFILAFSDIKSARREESHKTMPEANFLQVMSFPRIVEYVLKTGCEGIIINHSTKPLFLHRDLLINELDNIIKYSHNPKIDSYMKYCISI